MQTKKRVERQTHLKDNTRLFQQIHFDIGTSDFARTAEVNTNEFTLGEESEYQPTSIDSPLAMPVEPFAADVLMQ